MSRSRETARPEASLADTASQGSEVSAAGAGDEEIELRGWANRVLGVATLGLLAGVVATVLLQVVMRYFVGRPLPWTDELARYMLVWLTFLGGALAYRLRSHIAVDALATLLASRGLRTAENVVAAFVHVITATFAGVLLVSGIELVQQTLHRTTPALGIPMGWVYLAVPVAGVIMLVTIAQWVLQALWTRRSASRGRAHG